jgi:hypothetical protein
MLWLRSVPFQRPNNRQLTSAYGADPLRRLLLARNSRPAWVASQWATMVAIVVMDDATSDMQFGPLSFWAVGRLPEPTSDPWWIDEVQCRAVVSSSGVTVEITGSLPSRNVRFYLTELEALHRDLEGVATLDGSDMGLVVTLQSMGAAGHVRAAIRMWPGGLWTSSMEAEFDCDQSYLPRLIASAREILRRFPVMVDTTISTINASEQGH